VLLHPRRLRLRLHLPPIEAARDQRRRPPSTNNSCNTQTAKKKDNQIIFLR
jgi:hypothetical protein